MAVQHEPRRWGAWCCWQERWWQMSAPKELKLTKREYAQLDKASAISNFPATIEEACFVHSILCQVGFPHGRVDGDKFERKSGGASLLVEAGHLWNGDEFVKQQVPFGPMPRLIIAWLNQQAKILNTNEIPIPKCPCAFLKELGKKVSGGKTGTISNFKMQMQGLAACSVTLGINAKGYAHTISTKLIKEFQAWQSTSRWPDTLVLSDDYTNSLLDNRAVPIDLRAYQYLSRSSLKMDVYSWAVLRFPKVQLEDHIHWLSLKQQFGQEYDWKDGYKDFKREFKDALNTVHFVYSGMRFEFDETGLLLYPSLPAIPFKD